MSNDFITRTIQEKDHNWILALNDVHVKATSPLDASGLRNLLEETVFTSVIDEQSGFVFCLDQDSPHDGVNFAWFRARYDRFLYVDRIVVDLTKNRKGSGRALYEAVFTEAARRDLPFVCAEVNVDPPNPVSLAFHDKLGFKSLGDVYLPDRDKTVRYFAKPIPT